MYLYIELWKARPAWLTLAQDERQRFMETVGQELGKQMNAGAELVAVTRNDADAMHRADYDFAAVWTIADRGKVDAFVQGSIGIGWHEYFEQQDVRGTMMEPEAFAGALLALKQAT